ncbi:MAG: dienelactone hydrolase family protein [Thermoleophilia bacterium]
MDQTIIDLYDRFTHGGMSRADFLDRLSELTGSRTTAAALLSQLQNDYAQAARVSEDDPRLVSERASYDSAEGRVNGYLVRPKAKGRHPAVLVVHENRGLNPHLEDVARRLAVEGFLAGTQHAFNNDTGAARYNKAAADLAWSRTITFLKDTLGPPSTA